MITVSDRFGPAVLLAVSATLVLLAVPLPRQVHAWVDPVTNLVEVPFRIRQAWGLYGHGPPLCRVLVVDVDGRTVYRTNDPTHDWYAPQLAYRRIRPLVDVSVGASAPRNWRGFARLVTTEARRSFPDAQRVEMIVHEGEFPCVGLPEVGRIVNEAPDWEPYGTGSGSTGSEGTVD